MEFVRSWLLSITAAALAGMLVYVLAPKGGTKKALRVVTAVFFLAAFFLPFGRLELDGLSLPEIEENAAFQSSSLALEELVNEQILGARKDAVSLIINRELESLGLPQAQLEFIAGGAELEAVEVTGLSAGLCVGLEHEITRQTGLEVKVVAK
ncbi:MAG: hypothetical protein LBQ80_05845 [Clostridium sp.]|jgi:hypothetical protein|nr:hypothetical protein [Clostridium sp.]